MKDVVIVSACRTAIGAFGGTLRDSDGASLAAVTMKEAIRRAGIDPACSSTTSATVAVWSRRTP